MKVGFFSPPPESVAPLLTQISFVSGSVVPTRASELCFTLPSFQRENFLPPQPIRFPVQVDGMIFSGRCLYPLLLLAQVGTGLPLDEQPIHPFCPHKESPLLKDHHRSAASPHFAQSHGSTLLSFLGLNCRTSPFSPLRRGPGHFPPTKILLPSERRDIQTSATALVLGPSDNSSPTSVFFVFSQIEQYYETD